MEIQINNKLNCMAIMNQIIHDVQTTVAEPGYCSGRVHSEQAAQTHRGRGAHPQWSLRESSGGGSYYRGQGQSPQRILGLLKPFYF